MGAEVRVPQGFGFRASRLGLGSLRHMRRGMALQSFIKEYLRSPLL